MKRGEELPQSKLTENNIREIHSIVEERNNLRKKLRGMTNKAIADKFGVHERTIDKVTNYYTWGHVE